MKLTNIPAPEWTYPTLTIHSLCEIIKEGIKGTNGGILCKGVRKVGLVGSMVRGEDVRNSDVDLLLDSAYFSDDLPILGEYVGRLLDQKYNKRLDIIDFRFAMDVVMGNKAVDEIWRFKSGYERMVKEVIWLYEQ